MERDLLRNLARLQAHRIITGKERAIIDYYLLQKSNKSKNTVHDICKTLSISNYTAYHLVKSLEKKEIIQKNSLNFSKITALGTSIAVHCKNRNTLTRDEFSVKWENHRRELLYFLLSRKIKTDDAEDILQESFLKAWKNIDRFKKGTNFRAWIFFITKNTMRDFFRKHCNFQYDENRDHPVENTIEYSEEEEILLKPYIKKLPEEYQEVLHLSLHSIPYREISVLLNLPMGTIKSRIHRAKTLLKKVIESSASQSES
jgi:RNA polymerase sigma-70 factor, ECF subfamily